MDSWVGNPVVHTSRVICLNVTIYSVDFIFLSSFLSLCHPSYTSFLSSILQSCNPSFPLSFTLVPSIRCSILPSFMFPSSVMTNPLFHITLRIFTLSRILIAPLTYINHPPAHNRHIPQSIHPSHLHTFLQHTHNTTPPPPSLPTHAPRTYHPPSTHHTHRAPTHYPPPTQLTHKRPQSNTPSTIYPTRTPTTPSSHQIPITYISNIGRNISRY